MNKIRSLGSRGRHSGEALLARPFAEPVQARRPCAAFYWGSAADGPPLCPGPGSLRSFLCTILDRALVDIVRRAQADKREGARRVSSLDGEEGARAEGPTAAQLPSKDPTPTSRARTTELRCLCRSALDKSE